MDTIPYLQDFISSCFYLAVGVRLILISARSGQPTERLLGLSFLLWSMAGATWLLLQFVVLLYCADYEATQEWNVGIGIAFGFVELAPIVMICLVFFPPAYYRDWIRRATPA